MNYFRQISILLILILNHFFQITESIAQPQPEWVQRFNSPENYDDNVTDMAIDKSGNVYLTGYINISSINKDYVTIKYNSSGIEQWVRYYDGPDHREDKSGAIAVDEEGNVIVTGYSYSYSEYDDIVTIKYNTTGDSIWIRKFIGVGHVSDRPKAMSLDNYGNIFITASGVTCELCPPDILTIKYNMSGNIIWYRYYNGPTNEYEDVHGIYVNTDNIYLAGRSVINNVQHGIILKYDSNGDFNWVSSENSVSIFYSVGVDDSDFVYACGNTGTNNNTDISITKFDSGGTLKWHRTYNRSDTIPNQNDYFRAFALDHNGNSYITGVNTDNVHRWDIATLKYNRFGDTIWTRIYDGLGTSNDESRSIFYDKFGNVYVAGSSDGGLFTKYVTLKYSSNGNLSWSAFYNNNSPFTSHTASKVLCDTSGNVYVTGLSIGTAGLDIATIKYSYLLGFSNNSLLTEPDYKLYQNYPNPFNSTTMINYYIPVTSEIVINIYDAAGKIVQILVDELQNSGLYSIKFDGSELSSGVYFYSLLINNVTIDTKKLILIK